MTRLDHSTPPDSEPRKARLPYLLRFLGLHMALGMAAGIAFAALVVLFNVGALKDLISTTEQPVLAQFMLYAMFALTFASLAMGVAIMTLPHDDTDDMRDPDDPRD